jgi:uncharacterized protein YciI
MAHFAVVRHYTDDTARIQEAREAHLAYVQGLAKNGSLTVGGLLNEGTGALLVFDVENEAQLAPLLRADPHWEKGVIVDEQVYPWNVVIGSLPG